ncbi:MAG TPA: DMT family transporter [Candidatus Dorea intestinavium]|nr:DMT family transporter [Candidatus Dorea intestinavium]
MENKNRNMIFLAITAFIWGTAFVAQSVGNDFMGPYTFNGVRCLIGAFTLFLLILILDHSKKKEENFYKKKDLLIGGALCGILLFAASTLQQIGIQYTTAGKGGFITAFYIVFVPVLGIFFKKKTGVKVWISVMIALLGLYLLCVNESLHIEKGDLLILICSLIFSLHIIVIDTFSPKVDCVKMSFLQFLIAGILSLPPMFLLETPKITDMVIGWFPLLYTGVLSCGIAYTLQMVGQKNVNPTIASLILSLESCFSVIAGWIILGEKLNIREGTGCVLMFCAILITQIPSKKIVRRKEHEICNSTSK